MLTEVDIKRIMCTKMQLSEAVAAETDIDCIDEIELVEMQDEDTPVSETNGLI
ncbi:MAG: hypothetical protein HKO86_02555 [Gammaproteobacteria bacterium]|nr:hypothetical protein [Gammaproteobacteria bacterium]NNL06578.1 hypothetical protein [Gammaproteobacteria bacterium]